MTTQSRGTAASTRSAGSERTVLELRGVTKVFGRGEAQTVALQGVDLRVEPGQFVTVVGASGCGKSTMLNLIAGLEQPTEGTITVDGNVAFMFQDQTLLPWLTSRQNVDLALRLAGVDRERRGARTQDLLEQVNLGGFEDKRPHELSGGMRQRVSLARVLAQDAQVVLMDEPLGALDAMTRDKMHDEIERIWTQLGLTVVFVTHNMREAVRLGDRVVLLSSRPGRVKRDTGIDLPRPRKMDSPEVATHAAELTDALSEEVSAHVG